MMKVAYEGYVLLAGWRLEASVVLAAGPDAPSRLAAISDADEDALGPRARTVLGCIVKSGSLWADEMCLMGRWPRRPRHCSPWALCLGRRAAGM